MWLVADAVHWTDKVSAVAAIVGALVGSAGIAFAAVQLTKQTRIRSAQQAQELMRFVVDLARVGVEVPRVYPHIHPGHAEELDLPSDTEELSRVLAYASGYISLGEIIGWQIRSRQMTDDAAVEWRHYFEELWKNSKAIRRLLLDNNDLVAAETKWLFGRAEAPPPKSVRHLAGRVSRRT